MNKRNLHPGLQDLIEDEYIGWYSDHLERYSALEQLSDWFLSVVEYIRREGPDRELDWDSYPAVLRGLQSSDPWPLMAIYDYVRAYSIPDEEIIKFGQWLHQAKIEIFKEL